MESLHRPAEQRLSGRDAPDAPFLVPGREPPPGWVSSVPGREPPPGWASSVPGRAPIQAKRAIPGGELRAPARIAAGGGQPLPEAVRGKMEASLGADFSAVRVHEGPEAASVGALAFARGDDIHFQPGRYDPTSPAGQELLGHELTHVVQQREGRVPATTQAKGIEINADASLEREADELGARAARDGGAASTIRASHGAATGAGVVQRVLVADLVLTNDEIWEEVSWYLFDDRKIPSTHRSAARDHFDRLPEEAEYEYFEDVADQLEAKLCAQLGEQFGTLRQRPEDSDEPSGGSGGGWFWPAMKLLVGYLALSSMIPTVGASPVPPTGATGGPSPTPTGGTCPVGGNATMPADPTGLGTTPLTCTVDVLGALICSSPPSMTMLANVQCEPSVVDLCTTARTNPIYDGLIQEVDKVCDKLTIEAPSNKIGACVMSPNHAPIGGSVSCKQLPDYDASKIGHELEHAFDHCRASASGGKLGPSAMVSSEIHAHTVQAATAKLDTLQGKPIDRRDQELVASFDAGCPEPTATTKLDTTTDGMYSIVNMYHELYIKTPISRTDLVATYGTKIRRGVARYNDMVSAQTYTQSRNYKHIK